MARGMSGGVVREMARIYGAGTVAGLTDGQLLDRFLARRDEVAFEALVARHGPMVLGVCRGILKDPTDAEDAFQAAFLVLVRKAGSIRGREALGGWLHRVTYRIALKARKAGGRRAGDAVGVEEGGAEPIDGRSLGPEAAARLHELRALLHEELDRLPERYRTPIVLCDLQGLSHDEAARRLRWPVGTVKGRLSRARERLKGRLISRGVTAPAGLLGASCLATPARAAVPDALRHATVKAGMAAATGGGSAALTAMGISSTTMTLAQGALRTMGMAKLKTAALGMALLVGSVGGGVGLANRGEPGDDGGSSQRSRESSSPVIDEYNALRGYWFLVSEEHDGVVTQPNPARRPAAGLLIEADQFLYGTLDDAGGFELNQKVQFYVDPTRSPREIDFLHRRDGQVLLNRAIYRLDGDKLTVCSQGGIGRPRPSSFGTKPGSQRQQLVWRRAERANARRAAEEAAAEAELDKLQGRWEIVSIEQSGADEPLPGTPLHVVIAGTAITFDSVLPKIPTVFASRFSLEPATSPRGINPFDPMPGQRLAPFGIYEVEGDTLRLCIDPTGIVRPVGFETDKSTYRLFILKRESRSELDVQTTGRRDPADGEARDDLDRLQGVWYRTSSLLGPGQSRGFEPWEQPILVVRGDGFYFGGPGDTPESVVDGDPETFTLDESADPKRIALQPNRHARELGQVGLAGVYRLEGDTLTLALGGANEPATSFDPASGGLFVDVYQRAMPEPGAEDNREDQDGEGGTNPLTPAQPAPAELPADATAESSDSTADLRASSRARAELDLLEMEVEADKRAIQELMDLVRKSDLPPMPGSYEVSATEDREERDRRDEYDVEIRALLNEMRAKYIEKSAQLAEETRRLEESDAGEAESASAMATARGGEIEVTSPRKAQPGDLLRIGVLEALPGRPIGGEMVVRSDGTIGLSFYGNLFVAGLTRDEIKEKLVLHLRQYLTDDALGLVERDSETGEEVRIPPVESDRVFVDDSENELRPPRAGYELLRQKLDRVIQRVEDLERRAK